MSFLSIGWSLAAGVSAPARLEQRAVPQSPVRSEQQRGSRKGLRPEDIEVIRLTPEEAEQRSRDGQYQPAFEQAFQEGEVFIPLMREEAVADKEVQIREVIQARPEVTTEEKQLSRGFAKTWD